MKKEIRIFFTALMFLTRLPVPRYTDHDPLYLEKAARYFSWVGWIVAFIQGLCFLFFQSLLSTEIALLLAMGVGIITTGAFHEDGFADVCDAFGGGWTKEKILEIMKDSRLGTYGVTGLIFILSAKFLFLKELLPAAQLISPLTVIMALIAAHALSRFMAVVAIQFSQYVFAGDASKSKPLASQRLSGPALLVALSGAALPFALLPTPWVMAVLPLFLITFLQLRYFHRWIGGYTGDCLGTIQQSAELVCYLSFLLLWKYT
jgi:adenosylcobinamide-GDP ribazoletransferase